VVLAKLQDDHDRAAHATADVRDCPVCRRRYGLDDPLRAVVEVWVDGLPRSWWRSADARPDEADEWDRDGDEAKPDPRGVVVAVSAPEPCSFCGAPADRADAVGLEWSAFPEREVACSAAHAARLVATRTLGVVVRRQPLAPLAGAA